MTGPGSGAPDRDVTADPASRRGMGGRILAVLAIGLIFRLIIAYAIPELRGSGFRQDLEAFQFWAANLADQGPFGFYERDFFHDYTPGYLYVLYLVGLAGNALGGVGDLIKLPPILADVALGWLVYRMVLDLGASERRAVLGAAIVVASPITWFDSVVWGQVDSFGVVFLLMSVRELWRGRTERAAILAVAAALIKPQLGILAPLIAAVTIRRAFWPAGSWGGDDPPAAGGRGWLERVPDGPWRIVSTGLAGLLTAVLISLPFGMSVVEPSPAFPYVDSDLVRQIFSTAAGYPYLTVNAYNLWALFPVDGGSMATHGGWIYDVVNPEGAAYASILGIPAVAIGSVALLAVMTGVSVVVARRPSRLTILVGLAVLALAFFALPTRVHERYLFPLFALGAVLAAVSWRWLAAYVAASVATFLNMYVVLTTLYPDNPSISDWLGIGGAIRSPWGVALVAIVHTAVLAWALVQLLPGRRATLAAEAAAAAIEGTGTAEAAGSGSGGSDAPGPAPGTGPLPAPAPRPPASPAVPAVAVPSRPATARPAAPHRLLPAWFDRPTLGELGPIGWLRARMGETPLRPDRSVELAREPRGRLDRLDLWLVLVLVVASLFLRTFRLAEPTRMHFDEVYHARTAAEFLQDWRYGIDHNIYEWTHPHLAKYAIAGGLVLFAGHDVEATSELGVAVRDAAIEPRRAEILGSARDGDRAWIATGEEVVGYDLATRALAVRWPVPGAAAVAFSDDTSELLVGTDGGEVLLLDGAGLDLIRESSPTDPLVAPEPIAAVDGPIARLVPFPGGGAIAALLPLGVVVVLDATGEEAGRATVEGAAELLPVGTGDAILATPAEVADPVAVAVELAAILGGAAADYEAALASSDLETVIIDGRLTSDVRTELQASIDDGALPGIRIDKVPMVGVAGAAGVSFLTEAGTVASSVDLAGGAAGLALVSGVDEGTQVYATTTDPETGDGEVAVIDVSGEGAANGPRAGTPIQLPAPGTRIVFDVTSELVEVLGTTPDGTATTVYVIEPHGKSVFADHRLPFVPAAMVLDTNGQFPSSDRGALLAFDAGGAAASLDVGHYAFAWRLPGVIAGALTVGVLYLLARVLFARRAVGVLVGLFALLDGMLFVQSRIAMNDVYTGLFILAAYLLFARIWLEPERPRWSFWAVMPVIGVLLGLALASKWVAAYAIGSLGILVLVRSALGRLILVGALVGLTAVLGWMALAVPPDSGASGNLTFALLMIGLTLAAVAVAVYHPIAWSDEEVAFAIGAPAVAGIVVAFGSIALGRASTAVDLGPVSFTPLHAGFALVALGIAAWAAFAVAGRAGFGPLARPPAPGDLRAGLNPPAPPAPGWLRLGSGLGLPVAWMLACLVAIPLAVYVVSYLPWAFIEGHQIVAGWPEGHAGQTLVDLTGEMYRYHNNLTAAHAASSPWWAWPLNLKPVWFYQGSFAGGTAASIYDAGNMVVWWLGVPALVFVAVQAFRRRSLALALVLIAFLAQWVSWARIDRAAFQYHYYTSLPFVIIALGYFVAELWHGASRRTWWLARLAAGVAFLGPVILWLLRAPLCGLANVEAVNAGSQACTGNPGNLVITPSVAAIALVGIVSAIVLLRMLWELGRPREDGRPLAARDLLPLVATALAGGAALAVARLLPSGDPLFSFPGIVPELIALVIAVPLGLVAAQVVTARDSRRFVVGLVAAVAIWFAVLYPNIAALPLPSTVVNAYQGLLPTYLYPFQFSVNTVDRSGSISFQDARFALLVVFLVVACAVVAYSAWVWRAALVSGDDGADPDAGGAEDGPAAAAGAA